MRKPRVSTGPLSHVGRQGSHFGLHGCSHFGSHLGLHGGGQDEWQSFSQQSPPRFTVCDWPSEFDWVLFCVAVLLVEAFTSFPLFWFAGPWLNAAPFQPLVTTGSDFAS